MNKRYMLLSVDDARELAKSPETAIDRQIADSVNADTGGDFQEIADLLKAIPICTACNHEGMASNCNALDARKLGRRLARLIERANARRVASKPRP
jgi:hypothetical protein